MTIFNKRACGDWRCGWTGAEADLLIAPNPFSEGDFLSACPRCHEQNVHTCCDEPECYAPDTCGFPTPAGYRRTCGKHYQQYQK